MDANDIAVLGSESEPPGQAKKLLCIALRVAVTAKKLKATLKKNNISFTECDINISAAAKRQ